jgi:hypothetical protein
MHHSDPIAELTQPLARQLHRRRVAIDTEQLRCARFEHRPRVPPEPDRPVHEHPAPRWCEVLEHFLDHDRLVHITP